VMASTTSTEQSGLFAHCCRRSRRPAASTSRVALAPAALDAARRGDADVVFVHDRWPKRIRREASAQTPAVMYNDFVLIGPKPIAGVKARTSSALAKLGAQARLRFARDKSGTHAAELRYWKMPTSTPPQAAEGYSCGCGMAGAEHRASTNAYAWPTRTWLNFKNRADLGIVVEATRACSTSTV